jgi:type III restriction enzyme
LKSTRRKKKKNGRYRRGIYSSPVAGICKFRSSWEEKYMCYLDNNSEVDVWSYEKLAIEYVANKSTGKIRKYYPDFLVQLKSGSKLVVEIKQKRKIDTLAVKKKTQAAEKWCSENGASFVLITEIELKELGIL